jgi:hypothetical protein
VHNRYFNYIVVADADNRTTIQKERKNYLAQTHKFQLVKLEKRKILILYGQSYH